MAEMVCLHHSLIYKVYKCFYLFLWGVTDSQFYSCRAFPIPFKFGSHYFMQRRFILRENCGIRKQQAFVFKFKRLVGIPT